MNWRHLLIPAILLSGCAWGSPEGGRLAIATEFDDGWEVVVVDLDRDSAVQLTRNMAYDFDPVWSPDGARIAYTSEYVMGEIQELEVPVEGGGTRLETKEITGDRDILIASGDGTEIIRLGEVGINDEQPAWSPDGERIAFVSDRSGSVNIWVMDIDGGNARQVSDHPTEDWMPSWSPDGSTIAFTSKRTGTWELHLVDPDGGNLRQVTGSETATDNWGPVWSPDGSRIAFARMISDDWEVFTMAAEGGDLTRLTDRPGIDFEPVWSPDGERIAFGSNRGGLTAVFLMSADGSDAEEVGIVGVPSDWTNN